MRTIKEVMKNEDGSIDIIDSENIKYSKCYLKSWSGPENNAVEHEEIEKVDFKISNGLMPEYNLYMKDREFQVRWIEFPQGYNFKMSEIKLPKPNDKGEIK